MNARLDNSHLRDDGSRRCCAPAPQLLGGAGISSNTRSGRDEGVAGSPKRTLASDITAAANSSSDVQPEAAARLLFARSETLPDCFIESSAPMLTTSARIYSHRWRLPTDITEADLMRGYEGAAPWTSEAR